MENEHVLEDISENFKEFSIKSKTDVEIEVHEGTVAQTLSTALFCMCSLQTDLIVESELATI